MSGATNPYESPRAQPDEVDNSAKRKVIEGFFLGFFGLVAVGLMILMIVIGWAISYLPITLLPSQSAYLVTYLSVLFCEGLLGSGAYFLFKGARRCFTQSKEL